MINLNQKLDLNMLSSNLKYIEFDWMDFEREYFDKITIPKYVNIVNNLPNYYNVKIFLSKNILSNWNLK